MINFFRFKISFRAVCIDLGAFVVYMYYLCSWKPAKYT